MLQENIIWFLQQINSKERKINGKETKTDQRDIATKINVYPIFGI